MKSLDLDYIEKATQNEIVLDLLDVDVLAHRTWVVIVAFYSALRYVDSLIPMSDYGVHSRRHSSRIAKVARHPLGPVIELSFLRLYNLSMTARYELHVISDTEALGAIKDLSTIKQHILAYGATPSNR